MTARRGGYFEAVDRFLAYLRDQRRASAETLRAYEGDLARFGAYLREEHAGGPPGGPETIDSFALRGFIARLHREGLSRASIARRLSAVRSMLRHAVREGLLETVPGGAIPTPRVPRRLPRTLTVDEVFHLLDGIAGDEPAAVRDRALLEFLYATGLRVGELVSLDLDDVDLDGGMVRVLGKGRKERMVPFGRKAQTALRAWIAASRPLRRAGGNVEAVCLNLRG